MVELLLSDPDWCGSLVSCIYFTTHAPCHESFRSLLHRTAVSDTGRRSFSVSDGEGTPGIEHTSAAFHNHRWDVSVSEAAVEHAAH